MEWMRLDLSMLFFILFTSYLSKKPVSLEQIKVFLKFAAFRLIEGKLLLRRGSISLLKVNWINVIHSNNCKQEDTYVLSINLISLKSLVGLVNESSL